MTEPVDVVLVVTDCGAACSGWAAACYVQFSCLMVVRVGPRWMAVDGRMLLGVKTIFTSGTYVRVCF